MHFEILDAERLRLLRDLLRLPETAGFDLAGGTALSLQLGLRVSYDFNFFSPDDFNRGHLLARLREAFPRLEPLQLVHGTCDVLIDGVQVSFLHDPYPRISPAVTDPEGMPGLRLAGIDDIAAMKLSAIGGLASRKDFYDLYQIFQRCARFTPEHLLRCVHRKFGDAFDATYMLMSLTYFDDAEDEILPKCLVPADWQEIKRFFRAIQPRLMDLEQAHFSV